MKLGFIILAHNQPDAIRRLVDILAGAGHTVVVHFDKKAPDAQLQSLRALEPTYPGLVHILSEIHCVWSEWSLVEAVLVSLREFARMPDKPEYIHLMSGADFPIRPITDLEHFLRRNPGRDFIECCDITQRRWVKGGLSMERFRFFFPVNFRTSRKTFDRLVRWQRKLHIRRKIPLGMTPHMGSQWWTLRWSTCAKILDFLAANPRVVRYFRSTWIPDESFFQTVLAHLIPRHEIADLQLILHHLTPTGRPYVIYPDHLPLVRKIPHFFVRKIAPSALDGIESLARTRKSPIPRPQQLACVRDIVRGSIDENYQLSRHVPGHPYGAPPSRPRKPCVVFLTDSDAESALVRAHALAHPASLWCGRPFAPHGIELTEPMLAAAGLSRGMTNVRQWFTDQFADTMAAAFPADKVAVLVLQASDVEHASVLAHRIPEAQFFQLGLRAHPQQLPWGRSHSIPARGIRRVLENAAPTGASASPSPSPWIETRHFGRIGNYFHLDAIILADGVHHSEMAFLLPGVPYPVRAESVCSRPGPNGGTRILMLFWLDDGAFVEVTRQEPAHVVTIGGPSHRVPHPCHHLREASAHDMASMLESFGDSAAWSDRLVLEPLSSSSVTDRCAFIKLAKEHWPAETSDACLATVVADDSPSFFDHECSPADEAEPEACDSEWQDTISKIEEYSTGDAAAACALALETIRIPDLPRRNILRAVHPCLPRNSKWWLLALASNPDLGDEQVADALNSIGSSVLQEGQESLAELCFTAATLIHPPSQSPAWNLGQLLSSQGRISQAGQAFHSVRRHYANESVSTLWPAHQNTAWPGQPWPSAAFTLPEGTSRWPRISIVTPSYNQGHYIEETILSVLHQNYPNLQYIVVDGNSTDDTRSVLEKYRDRIDHLIIEPDDGQTQAINKGFRLADGEIIAWLNSDDMYAPGALHQAALRWLASGADVLAGICAEHRQHQFAVINKPSATNRDFNTAQLARIFPYWFSGTYFFQPEVFFTKSILEKVGLLDESLHYAMDYDLWMRFAKAGAHLEVIDWPFAFFRLHDAQKTTQSSACIAEQCAVRNRHHPLELREERRHQIDRQLAALQAKDTPAIAILGPHFPTEVQQAATANPSLIPLTDPSDPALASADAALIAIGSQRHELTLLQQLRTTHPNLLLLGWFLDHDHNPHANHDAALLVDIILPTNPTTGEYLRHDGAWMGGDIGTVVVGGLSGFPPVLPQRSP